MNNPNVLTFVGAIIQGLEAKMCKSWVEILLIGEI